ncbi:ATP-binding cassette sub-family B member 9 [Strongyloides ratti]|uniref:ATP-binding cassette sub-family B member 9 n=1 Tax=Strongyloides ratti TaxID=34506 RepID=A0A090LGL4_STRRB|nr:ATP-binding cassette sub-family B member 9 [Strongyloides ratti]CEF66655.1 ATP-binding cassette sub-family B member 9 [Strongyloides ratti]
MGTSRIFVPILALTYIVLDLTISSIAYGFYHEGYYFDKSVMTKLITLQDGYGFLTSPIEFSVVAILRAFVVIGGVVCFLMNKYPGLNFVLVSANFVSWSLSFVKLLALSEITQYHTYPGIYISLSWNFIAFVNLTILWCLYLDCPETPEWLQKFHRFLEDKFLCCKTLKSKDQAFITRFIEEQDEGRLLIDDDNRSENSSRSHVSTRTIIDDEQVTTFKKIEDDDELVEKLTTMSHVWKIIVYCKYHWTWFFFGFFFLTIYSSARIFIPYMTGTVLSNIVSGGGYKALVDSVVLMAALTMTATIFSGLRGGSFLYATSLIHKRMRNDLFRSLTQQEIGFFDEADTGSISSRLTSDCERMSSLISTNLNVFMRNTVMLVGALVFMFCMCWRLALVTIIAVPLLGFISKVYGSYYDMLGEKTQETIADANKKAEEVLSTMRTVRSFACEIKEADQFETCLYRTLDVRRKESLAYMGYTWMNEFCDNAVLVTVLFYGGHLVLSGRMTSSHLLKFLLYQLQIGENLLQITWVFQGLMQAVGSSRKVFEYILRKPKIKYDGKVMNPVQGKVSFNNVSFNYPTRPNQPVLNNMSFTVNPGETVAFVGPSGAGKSSVIALIQRFYTPNAGTITIDGVPIDNYNHEYYHQKIALVAQEPILYSGTIMENIKYGCSWITDEQVYEAAKLANCHNFIMDLEDGYETTCGEKGTKMSGGQKQRIAIARAMVRKPSVLILDEATSALDAESEHIIQEALNNCTQDKSVSKIVIAHRLSTIEKADRIFVVQKGVIIQEGSHQKLMEDSDGLYYNLVQKQLKLADEEVGILTTVSPISDRHGRSRTESRRSDTMSVSTHQATDNVFGTSIGSFGRTGLALRHQSVTNTMDHINDTDIQ